MRNSFAVCSLAVALCLIICVSGNGSVSKEEEATAAVEQAKAAVTEVHTRAQSELNKANGLLRRVELSKNQAAQALSQAEKTPQDNKKAQEIAEKIKRLSGAVDTSYSDAQGKLSTAVSTLNTLVEEGQRLVNAPEIVIKAKGDAPYDFTDTTTEAASLKRQADNLNDSITNAVTPVSEVGATADEMESNVKEAQLGDFQLSAIVAVAKIKSMLASADNIILQIERKKNGVSGIVGEMQTLQRNHPTVLDDNIKMLHQSAANALRDATDAVQNANNARRAIQTQKDTADAALTKIKAENQEVSVAQNEASTAQECVTAAERIVPQFNDALQTATNSLTSATDAKENLKTALSTATSATRPAQSVTNPKLKELQDSVSADVNRIQTMMGNADGTLQETKNNKKAVHDIVEEMKKLKTTAKIESNEDIKVLYNSADDALADATDAVKNAVKAKTDMTTQKQKANAALSRVETATDVNTAQKEVVITNACVSQANQFAAIINNALQTAKDSVTSITDLKKKLEKALSTTTSAPTPEEVKETEKANPPVEQRTEPDQKDTTIQPTSKDLPDQTDNSEDKPKDALVNSAQNVPTTALTGGKAAAPGANNDSAMTVSVPLLVALITSAVLQ